ncbi:MAG: DUF3237 domain-containing protein [Steroidobacteraceae bacterium]
MSIRRALLLTVTLMGATAFAQQAARPPLGTTPAAASLPVVEFAFEARVTLAPAVVLGETAIGRRQYIPITGGSVAGPKFKGEVIPGGWDYQLASSGSCGSLSADYFLRAADGTVIHVLNQGLTCPGSAAGTPPTYLRPQFEAPKGTHEWMTHATFVATLEPERSSATPGSPAKLEAVRIKFYQVR